jgi:phosphohistidine phosphatase SixA
MNRRLACQAVLVFALAPPWAAHADESSWRALREGPAVLLLRHAQTVPGVGDPPGFRLEDCKTQRNLSLEGRSQAVALGQTLASRGVKVTRVESSRWCRCLDTARLAFPALTVQPLDALNSFFDDRASEGERTTAARARIAAWRGPGVLVLVTHQVNISALTGRSTAMGGGVVLRAGATPQVVGEVAF